MRTFLTIAILFSMVWSINSKTLNILKAEKAPTIDGAITPEDNWSDNWQNIDQAWKGNTTNDMHAQFQLKYDTAFLYVLVKVFDTYKDTAVPNVWEKDCIQVYLAMDTNSNATGTYKAGDFDFLKVWQNNDVFFMGPYWSNKFFIDVAETTDNLSYTQEWKIPWSSLIKDMTTKWSGEYFKFDIEATDRTSSGRSQLMFWNSGADEQWHNTQYFGFVTLDSAINPPNQSGCFSNFEYYKVPDIYGPDSSLNPVDTSISTNEITIQFYNQSTGNISNVFWTFGDGTSSTEQNPTHTYIVEPWNTYTSVCLTAYTQDGGVCQSCKDVTLYEPSTCYAYFWYNRGYDSTGYSGNTFYFYDNSQGNIISWAWDFGDSTYSTEQNPVHTYTNVYGYITVTLKITTSSGCTSYTNNWIYISMPQPDQICQVTVDKKTGKNLILWSPSSDKRITQYNLQKESTISDVYTTIGTVSYEEAGRFIDKTSNPQKHADRYRLETISQNGYSNGFSNIHQTIHLAVSQGNPKYYNLSWTPYFGFYFSTYYIFRGKTADKLLLIDSISGNQTQYSDNYSGKAYYKVGVRSNYPCKSDSINYFKSGSLGDEIEDGIVFSNLQSLNADLIDEASLAFTANPNPFDNQINILSNVKNSKVSIEIFNTLGEKIYSYNTKEVVNGYFEHVINVADLRGATKVCIVKFTAGDKTGISKLIKK